VQSTGGAPSGTEIEQYAACLAAVPRGLIICGPEADAVVHPDAVLALGQALGYPILADPLSGLRSGPHDRSSLVCTYDAFLRDERFARHAAPQVVLRFGAMPTSKPVLQYLQRHPEARLLLIDPAGWRDPTLLTAEVVRLDPDRFCRTLAAALPAPAPSSGPRACDCGRKAETGATAVAGIPCAEPPGGWLGLWREAERRTRETLDRELAEVDELFEGRTMAELADLLPGGSTLVAGNSMPVRDIDTFFQGGERAIRILGNRGASGIDGVVSTALGIAAARMGPTVLAIGDISLYHDANGLLAARQHRLDLTIVLLNNDGGGIFSFLPQASLSLHHDRNHDGATFTAEARRRGDDAERRESDRPLLAAGMAQAIPERDCEENLFETLFGTPHSLDFTHLAALYGARYTRVSGWRQFRDAVSAGIGEGGLHLVEVPTERERNVALHRRLWPAVSAALDDLSYPPEKEEMS
jgi:2-succinyl-5-enolpyruvyl-6-hydroxy-3-cyclohexene-1-carboxylate synthase